MTREVSSVVCNLDAKAQVMAALSTAEAWSHIEDDDETVVERMHTLAVMCAREGNPEAAAALLTMMVERKPVSDMHAEFVDRAIRADPWPEWKADAQRRRALEALRYRETWRGVAMPAVPAVV